MRLVLLHKKGKETVVKAFADVALPKGLMVNDEIVDAKTFEFLLKQALAKPNFGKFDTSYAVVSLPESKSFVRVVQIPIMSETEAESAVPYEAESFIPLPIDQVYLDWQKIGETGEKMDILMVASPKEFVEKYLTILQRAGITPLALEVESQSCHRALIASGSKETSLILDAAAIRSSLLMIEQGNLQFTSTIPIGGSAFTESIARSLGVSSAKAEEIKRKVGLSNTAEYPNIKTSLLPVLNNLTAEVKNILKFHGEHSEKQVERVILCGAGSRLKNLQEFLAPQLAEAGVNKVEIGNPWQNVEGLKTVPMDASGALGFVAAIGLAMRGVDYKVY